MRNDRATDRTGNHGMRAQDLPFSNVPPSDPVKRLNSFEHGLSSDRVQIRLLERGRTGAPSRSIARAALLFAQFRSPIVLILLFATALAFFLGQPIDALIILAIVVASGLLGFWQEQGAAGAVEALLARVRVKASVLRDRHEVEVPIEDVVPGDVTVPNAGDVIPGDCLVLESKDLHVSEAALTGETFPAEKSPGLLPADTPLAGRSNCLFEGTHVVSGTARALVVRTGTETELGRLARHMAGARPETEFERGVRRFGYLLMEVTLLLVIAIFAVNVALERPVLDSLLFSIALAVGLTPQLLPAIVSVNLAHGARRMAGRGVIVKRLASIQDFGSMDVLCSDKTGTLTEGVVRVDSIVDHEGNPSEKARLCAFLNANFESGFSNPIDEAIRGDLPCDASTYRKCDEIPYDFLRKRLSILVERDGGGLLVTKGAVGAVLEVCTQAESAAGVVPLAGVRAEIDRRYEELGARGFRTLGVACRELEPAVKLGREHEAG